MGTLVLGGQQVRVFSDPLSLIDPRVRQVLRAGWAQAPPRAVQDVRERCGGDGDAGADLGGIGEKLR